MKNKNVTMIIVLIILFLFDIIKPFRYCLATEFIFLGILFVSLHYSLYFALGAGAICGYLKDALSYHCAMPSIIVFILLSVYVKYILHHFQRDIIHIFIIISAISAYAFFYAFSQATPTYKFMLFFISQSTLTFFLISRILKRWIIPAETND